MDHTFAIRRAEIAVLVLSIARHLRSPVSFSARVRGSAVRVHLSHDQVAALTPLATNEFIAVATTDWRLAKVLRAFPSTEILPDAA